MASRDLMRQLLPIGIVGGLGYLLYAKGEQEKAAGTQSGLASFAGEIDSLLGNINKSGGSGGGSSGGSGSGAPAGGGGSGGACSTLGFTDLTSLSADARSKNITNPTDPRSIIYGRTWWALNHGGDACSFNNASQADQITWQSFAINGH